MKNTIRTLAIAVTAAAATAGLTLPAMAGSPHFVGTPAFTADATTVTVTAKEAGLGNEPQIRVTVSGTARCVNPGGHDPQAANKASFTQAADEPVQNGQATYDITAGFGFSPSCSPPMTVQVTSLQVQDVTNGLTVVLVPAAP